MARGHAEALMPLIARVMDQAEIEFRQLDRIAVTIGPGSFTGLRVGISAARGIALAAGKPAIGLSTLAGFAAPHIAEDDATPVVAAIDARHDHVYLQVFGAGGRTLVAPRIASLREAVRAAHDGAGAHRRLGGRSDARRWPKSEPPPTLVDQRGAPDIGWIARLGAAAAEGTRPAASRSICARPTRSRRTPPGCRADDGLRAPACSRAASPPCRRRIRATPRHSPRSMARRSIAAGATTRSSACWSIAT